MTEAERQEQVAAQALREIADKHDGNLQPRTVVDEARDPEHPLHSRFEWDDSVAGERFRWIQARRLIASVRIEIHTESRVLHTYGYVRDTERENGEQGYTAVPRIMDDEQRKRDTLLAELERADAYIARVESLAATFGLLKEVQAVRRRWVKIMEQAAA